MDTRNTKHQNQNDFQISKHKSSSDLIDEAECVTFLPETSTTECTGQIAEDISEDNVDTTFTQEVLQSKSLWKSNSYIGLGLAICSGFLFASVGLIVKYLEGFHVLNLGFFRFLGMSLPAIPLVIYAEYNKKNKKCKDGNKSESIYDPIWPLSDKKRLKTMAVLLGRAFVGFAAVISHFSSLQYLPVTDAMVIGSCSSVFVTLVSHIFLREKCGVLPIASALLTIAGVGIIARPPLLTGEEGYNIDTLIGTCFALTRMVFTSVAIVFVRYLRGVNAALVLVVIGFLQLGQSTLGAVILNVFSLPSDPWHILLCVALGLLSFASQMCLTLALKCEQAGPFAVVRSSSDTLFAFLLQFVILGICPDLFSLLGAGLIISAVSLIVLGKWIGSLDNDHPLKKQCSLLSK